MVSHSRPPLLHSRPRQNSRSTSTRNSNFFRHCRRERSNHIDGHCYWRNVLLRVGIAFLKRNIKLMLWHCRTFSITSNSRMMYAFARDGGIPGHKFFAKVSVGWKSPVRTGLSIFIWCCWYLITFPLSTVWFACTLSFILGLPSLGSSVAFAAATSIATIGLYISYGLYALIFLLGTPLMRKLYRYSDRTSAHLSWSICPRSIPLGQIILSYRSRCRRLDSHHLHCICLASSECKAFFLLLGNGKLNSCLARQFTIVQLFHCRSRCCLLI